MTQEDKELLFKDLCARMPYGVICHYDTVIPLLGKVLNRGPLQEIRHKGEYFTVNGADCLYENIKPYLRPMSSMTEEEFKEYDNATDLDVSDSSETLKVNLAAKSRVRVSKWYHGTDWLNAHHFDYRGLIEKGLALEATKEMYL